MPRNATGKILHRIKKMVRIAMINKDLNDNENSVAAWIVKFLVERKVKVYLVFKEVIFSPFGIFNKLGIRIIDVRDGKLEFIWHKHIQF